MENVFLTSLTTPEIKELFRQELQAFFEKSSFTEHSIAGSEQPVNTKDLCYFLNITEPTLIRWRKKGKIPFMKIGSRILYQKSEVLDALNESNGRRSK